MWCNWVYMGNNQKFWSHFAEGILLVNFAIFSWCIANICSLMSQWDTFSKPKSISIVISGLLRCKLILQSEFPQIVLTLFLDFRIILSESCTWAQASTSWLHWMRTIIQLYYNDSVSQIITISVILPSLKCLCWPVRLFTKSKIYMLFLLRD